MTGLPLLPAVTVEFIGSGLAILLSFAALWYAWALVRLRPDNFIWGFLFYFCIAMAVFSLSRGVGHIIRISLVYRDHGAIWKRLSPFSGGLNTLLMISAAAVIIYYHKGLEAYKAIRAKAQKLTEANANLATSAEQLQQLNSHLEEMVEQRTRNLSESEKKFRNFFQNSKDIIYFCDRNGIITNINPSGMLLLGIDARQSAVNFHKLFQIPEDLSRYVTALHDNGFVSDLEIAISGRDNTTRHLLLTANALYDRDGVFIGCEGIGKDTTRIKTITEQLIYQEKMASIGQIAAGVAHEINTPLGIILGYTQLMMDDFARESETGTNLQVVERQTKACRRIVADLLKFSRQAESEKTWIDVNRVIDEVLSVTEHTLNINKILVVRQFVDDLPTIVGDAEKLHQVFINLFNNAQHAMQSGGELLIRTGKTDEEVLVSVEDSGTGIADSIKNRIFDPFFTTKEVGKGTGLGLSVTYGIVQEHGGTIQVESPRPASAASSKKAGTAFHLRFPITNNAGRSDQEHN